MTFSPDSIELWYVDFSVMTFLQIVVKYVYVVSSELYVLLAVRISVHVSFVRDIILKSLFL